MTWPKTTTGSCGRSSRWATTGRSCRPRADRGRAGARPGTAMSASPSADENREDTSERRRRDRSRRAAPADGDPVSNVQAALRSYISGLATAGFTVDPWALAPPGHVPSTFDLERQSADVTASYLRAANGIGSLTELYGSSRGCWPRSPSSSSSTWPTCDASSRWPRRRGALRRGAHRPISCTGSSLPPPATPGRLSSRRTSARRNWRRSTRRSPRRRPCIRRSSVDRRAGQGERPGAAATVRARGRDAERPRWGPRALRRSTLARGSAWRTPPDGPVPPDLLPPRRRRGVDVPHVDAHLGPEIDVLTPQLPGRRIASPNRHSTSSPTGRRLPLRVDGPPRSTVRLVRAQHGCPVELCADPPAGRRRWPAARGAVRVRLSGTTRRGRRRGRSPPRRRCPRRPHAPIRRYAGGGHRRSPSCGECWCRRSAPTSRCVRRTATREARRYRSTWSPSPDARTRRRRRSRWSAGTSCAVGSSPCTASRAATSSFNSRGTSCSTRSRRRAARAAPADDAANGREPRMTSIHQAT